MTSRNVTPALGSLFRLAERRLRAKPRRPNAISICRRLPSMGASIGRAAHCRRILVEMAMYGYKTIIGRRLEARTLLWASLSGSVWMSAGHRCGRRQRRDVVHSRCLPYLHVVNGS